MSDRYILVYYVCYICFFFIFCFELQNQIYSKNIEKKRKKKKKKFLKLDNLTNENWVNGFLRILKDAFLNYWFIISDIWQIICAIYVFCSFEQYFQVEKTKLKKKITSCHLNHFDESIIISSNFFLHKIFLRV